MNAFFKTKKVKDFISVIIPVYKDPEGIEVTLYSLKNQSLEKAKYEIIVANDGGDKKTEEVCKQYGVKTISLIPNKGSYAARNSALKESRGEYIAFVDADIQVSKDWLERGLEMLKQYDYVGGEVRIDETKLKTMAHYFEYLTAFNNERKFKKEHYTPTANLFIKRQVLEGVGFFNSKLYSGGDAEFGRRVYESKRFKMHFCPDLFVIHPPRGLEALLSKSQRVAMGSVDLFNSDPERFRYLKPSLLNPSFLKSVLSPFFKVITSKRRVSFYTRFKLVFWSIWFVFVSYARYKSVAK